MKVTVKFLDGEVLGGDSEAVTLEKMGFPVTLRQGNTRTVWVSLAAIKYVVLHGPGSSKHENDPRLNQGLPQAGMHFLDRDTLRRYKDEHFRQQSEGYNLQGWNAKS